MSEIDEFEYTLDGCTVTVFSGGQPNDELADITYELAMYFANASEIREISVAFGPQVFERNYRVTHGTPGNYSVSDWHIGWDEVFGEIVFADEYERIM